MLNLEQAVSTVNLLKDAICVLTVNVCYKNLSEAIARNQIHDLLYTVAVEFVKYIIEQQDRRLPTLTVQKIILRQFKCNKETLVLPLRPLFPYGVTAQLHHQFITVHSL